MKKETIKTASFALPAVVSAGVIVYFAGRILLPILLPFLLAFLIALLIHPPAVAIAEKIHVRREFPAVFLLILFFVLLGVVCFFAGERLYTECVQLLDRLNEENQILANAITAFSSMLEALQARFPFLSGAAAKSFGIEAEELFSTVFRSLLQVISSKLPSFLSKWFSSVPNFLLSFFVTLIASFYMVLDYRVLRGSLVSHLPEEAGRKTEEAVLSFRASLVGCLKAYSLLWLLTFSELFIGFSVLRFGYAFLPALLISLVDILPVLGVGSVLAPMALVRFFSGDPKTGIGLCILWGIISAVRQILEPKLVGKTLGFHPLITLFTMILGYRLMGVSGLLLAPFSLFLLRFLFFDKNEKKIP